MSQRKYEGFLPKFSEGQKVRIPPGKCSKSSRYAWIVGGTGLGGFCRGTGKRVKPKKNLYFVRYTKLANDSVMVHAFSEEFIQELRK